MQSKSRKRPTSTLVAGLVTVLMAVPAAGIAVGSETAAVTSANVESTAGAATSADNTTFFSTPTAGILIVGATDGASIAVPSVVGGEYLAHGQRGSGPRIIVAIFTLGGEVSVTWPDRNAPPSTIDSFFYPTELVPVQSAVGGGGYAPVADLGLQKNTDVLLTAWMARSVSGDGAEVGYMSFGRLAEGRVYESSSASADVGFPHWVGVAVPLGEVS